MEIIAVFFVVIKEFIKAQSTEQQQHQIIAQVAENSCFVVNNRIEFYLNIIK